MGWKCHAGCASHGEMIKILPDKNSCFCGVSETQDEKKFSCLVNSHSFRTNLKDANAVFENRFM